MRLYDRGIIIGGIVIFVILVTLPFWTGRGKAPAAPAPSLDTPVIQALAEKRCVEGKAFMRSNHMRLVTSWRDGVVREGNRSYVSSNGNVFETSLSGTCLKCHSNKDQFCDRCHNYVGARPNCWDCHIVPGEVK